ncbi:MAG TPA: hypothetical protein VJB39_02750 [Patescibacteria group bacterium]|nr:hypothetical protein [Patescibacteria group bacterium]
MNDRKKALLSQIIIEYIKSATPVGSKLLENKSSLGVSSATIRNEMAELEKEGYIIQPHTSAGRVPTEKGYKFFLANYVKEGKISSKEEQSLRQSITQSQIAEETVKALAKRLVELSNNAVVAAFSPHNFYYTGLSSLFNQPEFKNFNLIQDISQIIDQLDNIVGGIFDDIDKTTVFIGSANPFGDGCSVILGRWKYKKISGLMGILGPMRMDYEKNLGLINFITSLK